MNSNCVETLTHRGFKINIYSDEDPIDPRREFDNLGNIYMFGIKSYSLGDEQADYESQRQFLAGERQLAIVYSLDFRDYGGGISVRIDSDITDAIAAIHATTRLLPTLGEDEVCEDCSNEEADCLCRFEEYEDVDGFLFVTNEEVIKEWGDLSPKSIEKARKCILAELKLYQEYLEDGCYYFYIEELNQSTGGFYGYNWDENGLFEAAKEDIDWHIQKEVMAAKKKLWKLNSRKRYKHTHNNKHRKAA